MFRMEKKGRKKRKKYVKFVVRCMEICKQNGIMDKATLQKEGNEANQIEEEHAMSILDVFALLAAWACFCTA